MVENVEGNQVMAGKAIDLQAHDTGKLTDTVRKMINENVLQPGYCYYLPAGVSTEKFVKVYNRLMKERATMACYGILNDE